MSAREGVGYVPFLPWGPLSLSKTREKPETPPLTKIADHIRAKRLELALTQAGLAALLGIKRDTVTKWETGLRRPGTPLMPAIIRLLGYDPLPRAESFRERLRHARRALGLTAHQLANLLAIPAPTLHAWEQGLYEPPEQRRLDVEARLAELSR
jgi:DNA-binding transcriptional regulator YiaG